MPKLSKQELIDLLVKKRVKYMKGGSRKGWTGTITWYNHGQERVNIQWDSGVEQDYRLDAVYSHDDYVTPYIDVLEDDQQHSRKSEPPGAYVVLDESGDLVESFNTYDEAVAFSMEQVSDSLNFEKFYVYGGRALVQTRRPKAEVITSDGEVVEAADG